MHEVFAEHEAGFHDQAEAQAISGELMAVFNHINAGVVDEAAVLPADCVFLDDVLANLEPDAPVSEWSRGFAQGHGWLQDTWDEYVPDEYSDEFGTLVLALTFFSSRRLAEAYRTEMVFKKPLKEMAEVVREGFAGALADYARLGRAIARAASEPDESED